MKGDKVRPLTPKDRQYLRLIARKTWFFFETFVNSENHFLPPDNFQETPQPVVAHRTSPTNIGLYLLSILSTRDFGWIGVLDTVERLEATMATIQVLARHQGHLYNWYDTHDLRPLDPLYISTVDSGNLAGHLWAVGNACRQLASQPPVRTEILNGFHDVLCLIQQAAADVANDFRTESVLSYHWKEAFAAANETINKISTTSSDSLLNFDELKATALTLVDIARTFVGERRENQKKPARKFPGSITSEHSAGGEILKWSEIFLRQIDSHSRDLPQRNKTGELSPLFRQRLNDLADLCVATVKEMQFGFLFDPVKQIFSIGFLVKEKKLDVGYYDLLASEARLASFVAIAKGDVPALHWFRLSRSFRPLSNGMALLSWSGSMFEYLMPTLVMRSPTQSILYQTNIQIVRRQIDYGHEQGVPWGISESAYNVQNIEFTYQYSNFGVPGLGLKRGLAEDLVISPYATALAAMINPAAAVKNFKSDSTLIEIVKVHALHVDTAKGFVYLYGGTSRIKVGNDTINVQGAVVLNIKTDSLKIFVTMVKY